MKKAAITLRRAPRVKGGTVSADFCAEKAKPHIIAAKRSNKEEIYFFIFISVRVLICFFLGIVSLRAENVKCRTLYAYARVGALKNNNLFYALVP